jgi:hypothetical protein
MQPDSKFETDQDQKRKRSEPKTSLVQKWSIGITLQFREWTKRMFRRLGDWTSVEERKSIDPHFLK